MRFRCKQPHKSFNNPMVYVARNDDAVRAAKSHSTGIHIYIDMQLRLFI